MFIETENTPNENSLKFIPGQTVMAQGVVEFSKRQEAKGSYLAERLFSIEGTRTVFFGPDFVTVTKDERVEWKHMKPSVYAAIMDYFTIHKDKPLLGSAPAAEAVETDDPAVTELIHEILDTRIRPGIQDDGGDVEFKGFTNGVVKLRLQGACRTCSSSVVTLRNGIERMLKHYIPEVRAVEQVIDEKDSVSEKQLELTEKESGSRHGNGQ
jgi:Fe-S cluster biogenesis protein NfuA